VLTVTKFITGSARLVAEKDSAMALRFMAIPSFIFENLFMAVLI